MRLGTMLSMLLVVMAGALWGLEPTRAPVYYLLDYGGQHLDNPDYVAWVRELPPDLLHFGKDVPMTHLYGPIQAVGGENQAHGRHRADIRRLSPGEVRDRLATLQRLNRDLHAAGVRWVMPYIAAITMAGDPVRREGFFEFYDHWDEYREFGLGARPAAAPETWIATRADGSPHTFGNDLAPDYYTGMNRYVVCIEHPDWRAWLQQVTRLCAEAGYDGVFPDNSSAIACHAPSCQAAFRRYLEGRYGPAERAALFGSADLAGVRLPSERGSLLHVEAQRFYQTSLAHHLGAMRAAARAVNPDFLMFPNCGSPVLSAEYLLGHADFLMLEGGARDVQGTGCEVTSIIGEASHREVVDNILEYRYVAGLPEHIGLLLLEMGRTPWSRKLSLAEAAAFGSGACNGVRPSTREVLRPYIEFLRAHRDLYEGKRSAAQVAMAFFPMQVHYPDNRHWSTAARLKDRLGSLQVPFDVISETGLSAARLAGYRMVAVPDLRCVGDAEVEALRQYVTAGGTLLVVGRFAETDASLRPRPEPAWLSPPAAVAAGRIVRHGGVPGKADLAGMLGAAGVSTLIGTGTGREAPRPLLRVMLYEGPQERVLHLLNYDAPVAAAGGLPRALAGVPVRLALPPGAVVSGVTCLDPEAPGQELEFRTGDGVCEFTVPTVALYAVCRVRLQ